MDRLKLFAAALLLIGATPAFAQIKLDSAGRVTVGPGSHPEIKFRVENNVNTSHSYGVYGIASAGSYRKAVLGFASGGTISYGVYGLAQNGISNYAVFGEAFGSDNWAGMFVGRVMATGGFSPSPSDENLKENIRSLVSESVLEKLKTLQPRRFTFKRTPELERLNLPVGEQIGFIAQELESLFPELVSQVRLVLPQDPSHSTVGAPTVFEYKGVYYSEMIPLLVRAIQEQQQQIDAMEAILRANGLK